MATNGMTINGLNPLSALTADDKIPVWDTGASGEPTKEITAQNMANSVKSLASLPNTTEMNDAIAQSTASVLQINGSAVTFNANESKSIVFDVSRSNYVPLGIVGINTTSTEVLIISFRIYDNTAVVWCKNASSASLTTGVPYIFVLYMPS